MILKFENITSWFELASPGGDIETRLPKEIRCLKTADDKKYTTVAMEY